jgi:glycolate oxidase iron-sulfur subunit
MPPLMTEPSRYAALDPCVHCGFCLPACPTYLATGDENDSPRGRIVLMRALERGEIPPRDAALRKHLDACLGCRGCEPACPSGVGYGRGLAAAREDLAAANGLPFRTRVMLALFGHRPLWRAAFGFGKLVRRTGVAHRAAGGSSAGRLFGMLAATGPMDRSSPGASVRPSASASVRPSAGASVVLFTGCVMDVLFDHVHHATRLVLEANGYRLVEVTGQACCGAPHEHAGDPAGTRRLAERNVAALSDRADWIVVNSAGCGAMLRDYGHLLGTDEAAQVAGRVRDVTELLAQAGPETGAALDLDVAYDAPCHLQHAQGVHADVLAVLQAIPGLRLHLLPGHDRCCGGAGAYALLQPEMSRAVLADKVAAIRDAVPRPDVVATGNPGCIMQIGAGLRAEGLEIPVVHPVELLAWSYGRPPR